MGLAILTEGSWGDYLLAEVSISLDAVTRRGCILTESNIGLTVCTNVANKSRWL